MVAAAERAGVVLQVGHSHSYDLPIARMREIVASRRARPRPHDPHLELHRLDGAPAPRRRVRCRAGRRRHLSPGRASDRHPAADRRRAGEERARHDVRLGSTAAARSARTRSICNFADGAAATAVYNGYGHFSGDRADAGVGEWGFIETVEQRAPVTRPSAGRSAASRSWPPSASAPGARSRRARRIQPHFGLTLVSCERGDIRQSPDGLLSIRRGRARIALPTDKSPRDLVIEEFADAIAGKRPPHTGRWGLANLEVCTAAIEVLAHGREIELKHQVASPR